MSTQTFDVIVVGAGSGGLTAAVGLAKIGKSVLLVEREHLGGECTNSGCIPSKALLYHAKIYYKATQISGNNGNTENFRREAFTYVRSKIAEILEHETPEHFKKIGIEVLMGEAVFTSSSSLLVSNTQYNFKKAIIATGSRPRLIDFPGLDPQDILTNQNLFTLTTIPARTLIIGAGPIGLEMGQALAMLGSTVTILDNGPTFARLEDAAIQPIIKQACADLGITILQSASVTHAEPGVAVVAQENVTDLIHIPFDKILIAIGRVPNLPLGLEKALIKYTDAGISVSAQYQTTNKRIYALGDVADMQKFTHVADDVARSVVTRIATKGLFRFKKKAVPKVTYTKPELAQVGLAQTEAESIYDTKHIHRIEVPYSQNDRALTDSATNGILVVIVKRLSGKILGAHIAGESAGDLISLFTLAIDNNLSLWKLRRTIYAYPTYGLIIKKAGDIFFARQIQSLRQDIFSILKSFLPKFLLVVVWASVLIYLSEWKQMTGQNWNELSLSIFTFITGTMWGPLLYIAIYTFRPLIFFPASALTILSGIFFGLWGFVYTLIGANLSAMLAHAVGKFLSISPRSLPKLLQNISGPLRTHPFMTILTMHLTFMPFDAVNYSAGIFGAPFYKHAMATFLGTILGTFTFVSIGASLDVDEYMKNGITVNAINNQFLLLSAVIFVVSLGVANYLKKRG